MTTTELLALCHSVSTASVAAILDANQMAAEQGEWIPACGGSEVPFSTRSGHRLLYCYQPATGRHAYLNCETDVILTTEEAQVLLGRS